MTESGYVRPNHYNQQRGEAATLEMRAIFISYRRNDSEGETGRLFDDLVREFGEDSVFMDVTAIEAGRDFRKAIDESVASCGVLLAVIGKNWLESKDDSGRRRLDDPMDFVRLETASALKRDIPVIPVLVRGAAMPRAEHLPDDLKDLSYRNSVELTHARWGSDLHLLITALRRQLGEYKSGAVRAATDVDNPAAAEGSQPPAQRQQPPAEAVRTTEGTKKPSWLLPVVIVICAVVLAIVAFLFWPRQVTVPNVRGQTLSEATNNLERAHLKLGQTTSRVDATKDASVVLSQYPPSDEQVKRGTAIDLVIAQPAALVEVPALAGKSLASAQQALVDHQLTVGDVERQPRAGVARNVILQEFPLPGEMVKSGTKVDLLVSDVPQQTAPALKANAGKAADEKWAAQRAEVKREATLKAANRTAANTAAPVAPAANNPGAGKAAPEPAADQSRPRVNIRSASCTTLAPGQYRIDISGDAYAPTGETYLFYTWVAAGGNGTRWRPVCKSWSTPQASDDSLWEVSCIHRPNDPSQTMWETSRIITSQTRQAPTNGGATIFKPGMQSASNLKFNLTCQ
ncbi:MAG: PASTA domain-containing protein [Candidatus Korobacteraceae bacterium]